VQHSQASEQAMSLFTVVRGAPSWDNEVGLRARRA